MPVDPACRERFAILLEPLAAGRIGRSVGSGVPPVRVNVIRATDNYAEVVVDDSNQLRSVPIGLTRILWKASGFGLKWAIVQLSERPCFAIFQLSGTWQPSIASEPDG